jgi:hypothetical protein
MRGIAVRCLTAAVVALAPVPAAAQNGRTEPTSSEWLRQAPNPQPPKRLSDDQVSPVAHELPEAIARLERSPAVPLRDSEVQKFLGRPAPDADRKLRAYLVRAVFPSAHSMVHVRRDGSRLDIFADGLGCAPYTKHPIIVFTDRRPRRIYVMAGTVL